MRKTLQEGIVSVISARSEILTVLVVVLFAISGGILFTYIEGSGERSAVAKVEAVAEYSTGAVQGSESTLARYSFEGVEYRVLAKGGPYFADDTFLLPVAADGQVAFIPSPVEVAGLFLLGFLVFALIGAIFAWAVILLVDPY